MPEELKPCPFCGSDGRIGATSLSEPIEYYPSCEDHLNCGVELNLYQTKQKAIEAWNNRSE